MLSLTSDPQHPLLLEPSPSPCELHFLIDEEAEVQRGLAICLGNSTRSSRAGIGPPAPLTQSLSLNHSACSFQEGEGSTHDRQGVCAAMTILPVIASTLALEPPPRTQSPGPMALACPLQEHQTYRAPAAARAQTGVRACCCS